MAIYRCQTASQVSLYVGFLISWVSLPMKTTKFGTPRIKVISQYLGVSERVIVVYCQLSNFSAVSWQKQVNFQGDDDEVHFVLVGFL